MRVFKKLLLTLLLLALTGIIAVYILLQTTFGADQLRAWIQENTSYTISFKSLDHSITSPLSLTVNQVTVEDTEKNLLLRVQEATLRLKDFSLTSPLHLSQIQLKDGELILSPGKTSSFPIQSDRLQLQNMTLIYQDQDTRFRAENISGGISPWLPAENHILGNQYQFQASIPAFSVNDIPMKQLFIQGNYQEGAFTLKNFGADVAQGQLTGEAKWEPGKGWFIDSLRLSHVRKQFSETLDELWQQASGYPPITIKRLDLIDARLEGSGWTLNDLDLTIKNINFRQGDWHSREGSLVFNAVDLIVGDIYLQEPIVNLMLSEQGINIQQFTTRWEKGLIRTNGKWLRTQQQLALDEVMIAGLEYTLPTDTRTRLQLLMPSWLKTLSVQKLTANRNLLININPDFPFQLTAMDSYGGNLTLVQNHKAGIWAGELDINASEATFDRVDMRRPSISLNADEKGIHINEMSSFISNGLVEANALIKHKNDDPFELSARGRKIPLSIFSTWGWKEDLPQIDTDFSLNLQGNFTTENMLSSLNGLLEYIDKNGRKQQHIMKNGDIKARSVSPIINQQFEDIAFGDDLQTM